MCTRLQRHQPIICNGKNEFFPTGIATASFPTGDKAIKNLKNVVKIIFRLFILS